MCCISYIYLIIKFGDCIIFFSRLDVLTAQFVQVLLPFICDGVIEKEEQTNTPSGGKEPWHENTHELGIILTECHHAITIEVKLLEFWHVILFDRGIPG